jgi:hypothetical protein
MRCRPFGPQLFLYVTLTPTSRSGLFHFGPSGLNCKLKFVLYTPVQLVE